MSKLFLENQVIKNTPSGPTLQFTVTPKEWVPLLNLGKEKPRPIFPESKYKTCSCGRQIKSERHVCEGDYVVRTKPMRMPDGRIEQVWVDTLQRTHRASGRPWKPDPPRGHDGRKRKV